jgi:hypothetical protein
MNRTAMPPRRKLGAAAVLAALGYAIAPLPGAHAGAPGALPHGDPGSATYLTLQGAGAPATDRSVAHWHGQFTDPTNGGTYQYDMVGGDPAANVDVTIPVDIIPIDVTFSKQGNVALRGSDVVARTIASPIFRPTDWSSTPAVTAAADSAGTVQVLPGGELSAGNTGVDYLDALMRTQFNKVGTSYHVRLGHPTVLSPWKLDCSTRAGLGAYINDHGVIFGFCNNFPFDPPWGQWNLDPSHLVIFLGRNLLVGSSRGCCVLGYHLAGRAEGLGSGPTSGEGAQFVGTWMEATYLDPGLYNARTQPFQSDVTVLSHEIAEWADDPFDDNAIQPMLSPIPPQDGCMSILETADPLDRIAYSLPGNLYDTNPYADGRWHLQDIAFLPWFARQSPNTTSQSTQTPSAGVGRYTFMGALNPYPYFHQPPSSC